MNNLQKAMSKTNPVYVALGWAFDKADREFTKDGKEDPDHDRAYVRRWGRVWMLLLAIWYWMNGECEYPDWTFDQVIEHSLNASYDEVVVAMYG